MPSDLPHFTLPMMRLQLFAVISFLRSDGEQHRRKIHSLLNTESSANSVCVHSQLTGCIAFKPKVVDEYNLSMNDDDKANQ